MSLKKKEENTEDERQRDERETLAEQALEAIVRSQQLRERSRTERERRGNSHAEPPK
jgi:hypothetical protein